MSYTSSTMRSKPQGCLFGLGKTHMNTLSSCAAHAVVCGTYNKIIVNVVWGELMSMEQCKGCIQARTSYTYLEQATTFSVLLNPLYIDVPN